MTPKKTKKVTITDNICKTCDHEETYHKGRGFLPTTSCMVTGCRCRSYVFGRVQTTTSEVIE